MVVKFDNVRYFIIISFVIYEYVFKEAAIGWGDKKSIEDFVKE
jgi:hypothetical protein